MKQKIEDLKLLIKNDRRVMAGIGLAVFALLITVMTSGPKKGKSRRAPSFAQEETSPGNVAGSSGEHVNELITAFRATQDEHTEILRGVTQQIERLDKENKQQQEKYASVTEMVVSRMEGLDDAVKRLEAQVTQPPQLQDASAAGGSVEQTRPEDELATFGGEEAAAVPPPPPPLQLERRTFISPGDSVEVTLLTGVAAPTDGTPYPVVFQLDGPITGPDGSSLDLGQARIVAAAQGSETDARVIYRITDIAFRNSDGRRSVVKVDGWVVGEDGIRGMKGRVIDKLGQIIAATAGYSFVAALGESIDAQRRINALDFEQGQSISVNNSDLSGAGASALTDASNRLGQMLLDKYEKMIPVVEVAPGRKVAAIFARGAEVSVMEEDLDGEGIYAASAVD